MTSFAVAGAVGACGGSTPPASQQPVPPPPIISVPQVLDAGATAEVVDAGPPAPTLAAPTFVAKRQGTIRALAVDGRWVYWLTSDGDVKRAQSSGSAALKVESFGPTAIDMTTSTGQLWVTKGDAKTHAFALARSNPDLSNKSEALGTQSGTLAVLSGDAHRVAWGTGTGKKASFWIFTGDSKTPMKLPAIDATLPSTPSLSLTNAFYFDGNDVHSVPLATRNPGKNTPIYTQKDGVVHGLIARAGRIFLAVSPTVDDLEHDQVISIPDAGGDPTVVAKDQATISSFVSDGQNMYWTDRGTKAATFTDGKVMKQSLTDTSAPVLVAEKQHSPVKLAIDSENVYWANDNADSSDTDSDVLMIAK